MLKYLNFFIIFCLTSFLFFTLRLCWENIYFPRGILIVQSLLIFFQFNNRISVKYLALIFYLFILIYSTFGDGKSAISYNFTDFLFPLMVTVCQQTNYNCRLFMFVGEVIVLIILIVSTLFIINRKRVQLK